MAIKQANRFIQIETALGNPAGADADDNLVVAHVTGVEGLSVPYAYELGLLGPKDKTIDPSALINTAARLRIKHIPNESDPKSFDFVDRFGVFEQFSEAGTSGDTKVYQARLVPAFKMTMYETRFRVFEDMPLTAILEEVLKPWPLVKVSMQAVRGTDRDPVIPYAVQFGETTFNFIHRLLERFGIYYHFDHETGDARELMVLGIAESDPHRKQVMTLQEKGAGPRAIANWRRQSVAATQHALVGAFNHLNPLQDIRADVRITAQYDMISSSHQHVGVAFPVPAADSKAAEAFATHRMHRNEGGVFSVTGQCRNVLFRPNDGFIITDDKTHQKLANKSFLLRTVSFFAYETGPRSTGDSLLGFLKGLLKGAGIDIGGDDDKPDVPGAIAQSVLDQVKADVAKGKEVADWLGGGGSNPSSLPDFVADKIGRFATGIAGAVPAVIATFTALRDLFSKLDKLDQTGDYSCAFEALPWDAPFSRKLRTAAAAQKPIAYGPHLAVVVAPDGVDTSKRDLWHDALGRVRIRFPWDRGPKLDALEEGEPLKHDRNTCWVRVSENWAGDRFGSQFLPRIGQEVIVGFIDGDPEQPIIMGRAYNAATQKSGLPFLPGAAAGKPISKPADLVGTQSDMFYRSGIRTRSTPVPQGSDAGFHLLRFDDQRGKEQVLIRSQGRTDFTTMRSRHDTTHGNMHVVVGGKPPKDENKEPGGSRFTTIGGEEDLHVQGERYTNLDKGDTRTVKGDVLDDVQGKWSTYAGSEAVLSADNIILQAGQKITLRVGLSTIVLSPAGVYIDGAFVYLQQNGPAANAADSEVTDAADAGQADPGDPPDWLARQPPGGGGKRRTHTAKAKRALRLTATPDGKRLALSNANHAVRNLQVDASDPAYAERVAQDLNAVAHKDPDAIVAAGAGKHPVVFAKPDHPTDPPSASVNTNPAASTQAGQPTGRTKADGTPEMGTGEGSDTRVDYDPADWPRKGDPNNARESQEVAAEKLAEAQRAQNGQIPGNTFSGQVPPTPPPAPPPPPQQPPAPPPPNPVTDPRGS